jgi:hypothetical protein
MERHSLGWLGINWRPKALALCLPPFFPGFEQDLEKSFNRLRHDTKFLCNLQRCHLMIQQLGPRDSLPLRRIAAAMAGRKGINVVKLKRRTTP